MATRTGKLETPFDWITVGIFAGLVTHFIAHSVKDGERDISFLHYLVPSCGCALANWLGNEGYWPIAVLVLIAVGAYAWRFLRTAPASPHQ